MARPLFRRFSTWGAVFGGLTTLWMVLLPAAMGVGAWFWFDFGALSGDLDLAGRPTPDFAGAGILWWLVTIALPPAGFALCWTVLRARAVGLDNELALARRRAERKALFEESEALWQQVEAAEQAGEPAWQVTALDAWIAHARRVELTADLHADRIERLRQMARAVGPSDPDAAVRMLEEAKALTEAREGRALGLWPAMRGDLLRFALGFAAGMVGIPLLIMPAAFIVWALNMILAILAVAAVVLVIVFVVFGS